VAKRDEVDPADESGATEPSESTDDHTGSSTEEVLSRSPLESGEPGGTPERPVLAEPGATPDDDPAADDDPDDAEPVDEFDEIVRNSGVAADDPDPDGEDDDAKLLEPAGVAAASRSGSSVRRPVTPRTPKAAATDQRDQPVRRERTTPLKFVRQSIGELRKVVYPTGQQLINYFVVVLVFVLFVIAYVSLLDLGFGAAIFRIFS
jgi:preprotein translocase subunit SecE